MSNKSLNAFFIATLEHWFCKGLTFKGFILLCILLFARYKIVKVVSHFLKIYLCLNNFLYSTSLDYNSYLWNCSAFTLQQYLFFAWNWFIQKKVIQLKFASTYLNKFYPSIYSYVFLNNEYEIIFFCNLKFNSFFKIQKLFIAQELM
jgi:hypothetical protein